MYFIDWCENVLNKLIELGQASIDAQTYGIDEGTLAEALFSENTELTGEHARSISSATFELRALDFAREVGKGSSIWQVTETGRRHAKAVRTAWRDVCLVELDFAEQRQLLASVNRLSQKQADDHAWLEYVDYEILAAELSWAANWAQFRAAVFALSDLGLVKGEFASETASVRSTYRGLVWDTRCVKAKIFVSYRRGPSEALALLLAEKLSPYGISVFVDTLTVEGAEPFPARLEQGIADCDILVCLLAPGTLDSDWVRREIEKAVALNKPMIPVFQPEFSMPDTTTLVAPARKLLDYEGVKINTGYVSTAIDKLGAMIEETWFK